VEFHIRAALHDEAKDGWAWIIPAQDVEAPYVRIRNLANDKAVVCEQRVIDENFRRIYNGREYTRRIAPDEQVLVISTHYRKRLQIRSTEETANLEVAPRYGSIASLRAGWSHASPVVRVATKLGFVSLILGFLGLATGLVSLLVT